MQLFASCAPGWEALLGQELEQLGMDAVQPGHAGVLFAGDHAAMYRANLWLRTASRVQRIVFRGAVTARAQLLEVTRELAWKDWLRAERGIAIELHDAHASRETSESLAGNLARAIEAGLGTRSTQHAGGTRIVVHVHRGLATIGIDSSGKALHKRGYHSTSTHTAPLKETLAAALLCTARYDGSELFWDPMCGSGTLAIEACMIAVHKPPLMHRKKGEFAFEWFRDFDYRTWRTVSDAARRARRERPAAPIIASDASVARVHEAAIAAARARVRHHMGFYAARFERAHIPARAGLLIANLPYGERLGTTHELRDLYREVGSRIRGELATWRIALLVPDHALADELGIEPEHTIKVTNGALACRLIVTGPR